MTDYEYNSYEKDVLSLKGIDKQFRELTAIACRKTRLTNNKHDQRLRVINDTVANVAGPTIFFFVWWVLEQAKSRNIERLYFLARDGQILLKVANLINKKLNTFIP